MHITNIIEIFSHGSTRPHLAELSDGNKYVVKFPGNPEYNTVLINEFICHKIATDLGIPLQPFIIIPITEDFFIEFGNSISYEVHHITGNAFCSFYNTKANVINTPELIKLASNNCKFYDIMIFDFLIGNSDRNKGNLLYDQRFKKIVAIDHTHVFSIESLWMNNQLFHHLYKNFSFDDVHHYNLSLFNEFVNLNVECKNKYKNFIQNVKNYSKNRLNDIICECKDYWTINDQDSTNLLNYLWDRFQRVDEIISLLDLE